MCETALSAHKVQKHAQGKEPAPVAATGPVRVPLTTRLCGARDPSDPSGKSRARGSWTREVNFRHILYSVFTAEDKTHIVF